MSNKEYKKNCTLVVPGLLSQRYVEHSSGDRGVCGKGVLQIKELELFLAKAKQQSHDFKGVEDVLFDLFGVTSSEGQENPMAPVCYLADADTVADNNAMTWCLRADPVYLAPDRDDLVLSGSEVLLLSGPEAEHLAAELNALFEEDGWRLEAITATRWYLHLPEDPQIKTSDLSRVRDQPIKQFLPGGVNGKQWHRIMNEVQMVLHASEVNIERHKHGQLPVSSLWFWGGGELPQLNHSCWSQVWSSEVLSRGLAKVTRTPCLSVPKDCRAWLNQVNAPGEHMIVCDDFISFSEGSPQDSDVWCKAWQEFEREWLTPLLEALRNGEVDEITLNPCDGRTFNLKKSRLNHWWRRRKPVRSYCR